LKILKLFISANTLEEIKILKLFISANTLEEIQILKLFISANTFEEKMFTSDDEDESDAPSSTNLQGLVDSIK
jgi:hypothetical protein